MPGAFRQVYLDVPLGSGTPTPRPAGAGRAGHAELASHIASYSDDD
jgi:hypothetical protein